MCTCADRAKALHVHAQHMCNDACACTSTFEHTLLDPLINSHDDELNNVLVHLP